MVDRFGLGPCPRGIRTAAQPHRFDIGIDRVGLGSYPRGIRTRAAAMGTPIVRVWAELASELFFIGSNRIAIQKNSVPKIFDSQPMPPTWA